jgi:hypothetical protein
LIHGAIEERLLALLRRGKKAEAIALFSRTQLATIKEATAEVAALAERHDIPFKQTATGWFWWIVVGVALWLLVELIR